MPLKSKRRTVRPNEVRRKRRGKFRRSSLGGESKQPKLRKSAATVNCETKMGGELAAEVLSLASPRMVEQMYKQSNPVRKRRPGDSYNLNPIEEKEQSRQCSAQGYGISVGPCRISPPHPRGGFLKELRNFFVPKHVLFAAFF